MQVKRNVEGRGRRRLGCWKLSTAVAQRLSSARRLYVDQPGGRNQEPNLPGIVQGGYNEIGGIGFPRLFDAPQARQTATLSQLSVKSALTLTSLPG